MNIFNTFSAEIETLLSQAFPNLTDFSRVTLEPPRDPSHGDLSTNAAMVLAKSIGLNPRQFAEKLLPSLETLKGVSNVEIAGAGFINFRLTHDFWFSSLKSLLNAKDYGRSNVGKQVKVNVEYVSANPTGPMHVGHGRGAVFGDALASLLDFAGFNVTKEYYINDAGAQVEVLAKSALLRYREALGETITIPEGLYPGDYLCAVGERLAKDYGNKLLTQNDAQEIAKDVAISMMMEMIRSDLATLGVSHDVFFSERSLHKPVDSVKIMLDELTKQGNLYEGVLEKPKGVKDEEWEPREQTLFKAKLFGDDTDRALMKSDGSYTYFASDIAYHKNKYERGFKTQIDVWGADHGGYIKRVQAALKAVTNDEAKLDVKICQLVKLLRNGDPVKMSKRSGDFVTLAEVVEEVGRDAVRFMMLFRKNDATLDFDLAKVVEQSKDNPVFYVHYAHARCASLLAKSNEPLDNADFSLLTDEGELALIKLLAQYPRIIEQAALSHEPHRIAFYAHEVAGALNSHWSRGNNEPSLRFIIQNAPELTMARLALISAVKLVLKSALGVLGVEALDELR